MSMKVLVTGGAGFIGCHTTMAFGRQGCHVVIVDTLVRPGADENLRWLQAQNISYTHCAVDVRNDDALDRVFLEHGPFASVVHLAAQVAVTTSVAAPRIDFETNARGTFNVLECIRRYSPDALCIYASTNKVYGALHDLPLVEQKQRYDFDGRAAVDENQLLDFHSPYGCSKGCGDQYVIDYARIYNLRTVSFRQSCIYGERQFGVEDQGWVAWFIIAGVLGLPITVYGDGKQVRDLLYIGDLTELYTRALTMKDRLTGMALNIGGGRDNALSLLEFLDFLKGEGIRIECGHEPWRPGDQKIFISDNTRARELLGWTPRTSYREGFKRLISWVRDNRQLLERMLPARR